MRHVFIINPTAGKHRGGVQMIPRIRAFFAERGEEPVIRVTERPDHATALARREAARGGPVRVYACGGDGTLNEVASGLVGCENAALGVIPCGSGNDYIKTYGSPDLFADLAAQMEGVPTRVDMIRAGAAYAINVCSMGLDANVAFDMQRFKNMPLVSGMMAYNWSVVKNFLGPIGLPLTVEIDGEVALEGQYMFVLAACGRYYGGSYQGAPGAAPNKGELSIVAVKPVARRKVPGIINFYKSGQHQMLGDVLTTHKGRTMTIRTEQPANFNVDGETSPLQSVTLEIMPGAISFIVPGGVCPDWLG